MTVDGVAATAAKKLDAVKFAVTIEAGSVIESISVTYIDADNNTQTITPTDLGNGAYTFQMPAFAVKIEVVASVDKTALAAAIAGAEPYLNEALPTTIMTALNNAYSDAQTVYNDTDATGAQVSAATDALNFAVMDVQAAISYYAAYLELKAYADALVLVANDNATANTALATAISDAVTAVTNAAGSGDIDIANTNLRAAMDTYAAAANPVGTGAQFDLTFMLTNPDLTPFYTGAHGSKPEGWTTEQEGGNYQVIPSEDAANPDGIHKYAYEYWSDPAKQNGLFNLYTTVENLPVGTYNMSCYAFAQDQFAGTNTAGVYFYANDTQGSQVTNTTLTEQNVEFVNNTIQNVKIGLKPTATNTYNWMGIGYLKLYKVPAKSFTLDCDDEWDYTQEGAGDVVVMNRPIVNGFNTVVFPFSMTQAEV
ncbi:MAG: hypothetical protein II801_06030 [Bacteroidaceae bacterium]|nr:hypothetical protein [Bacteroidaceae bacterium]